MNVSRTTSLVGGSTLVTTGSLLLYFEAYRNNLIITGVSCLAMLMGWTVLFMQLTKGTRFDKNVNMFTGANPEPAKSRLIRLLSTAMMTAVVGGNLFLVWSMASNRKADILEYGPTKTTIATIGKIQAWRSRGSTSYDAVFIYIVDGKEIFHPRSENKDDFLTGQQYEIRYSVEYPEMFKILKAVQ